MTINRNLFNSSVIKYTGDVMFCPKCGARNKDDVQFCENCGSILPPPGAPAVGIPAFVQYAGFWTRVGAYFIDGIILTLIFIPLWFGLVFISYSYGSNDTFYGILFVSFLIQWLYFAGMESSTRQATLGKGAVGIIVTDLNGSRISLGRATVRYFAKYLSSFLFGIGYLMIALTEKKQGLHDMIAGCIIIKK